MMTITSITPSVINNLPSFNPFLDEPFDFSVCMDFLDIQGKLGEGGFGQVYLAYDNLNKRKVAVKILNNNDHPFMMNKETEALAKLKHRNIVKMYSYFPLPKKH